MLYCTTNCDIMGLHGSLNNPSGMVSHGPYLKRGLDGMVETARCGTIERESFSLSPLLLGSGPGLQYSRQRAIQRRYVIIT